MKNFSENYSSNNFFFSIFKKQKKMHIIYL